MLYDRYFLKILRPLFFKNFKDKKVDISANYLLYNSPLLQQIHKFPKQVQDVHIYLHADLYDPNVENIQLELEMSKEKLLLSIRTEH